MAACYHSQFKIWHNQRRTQFSRSKGKKNFSRVNQDMK